MTSAQLDRFVQPEKAQLVLDWLRAAPACYRCGVSGELVTHPVRLPSGATVDQTVAQGKGIPDRTLQAPLSHAAEINRIQLSIKPDNHQKQTAQMRRQPTGRGEARATISRKQYDPRALSKSND